MREFGPGTAVRILRTCGNPGPPVRRAVSSRMVIPVSDRSPRYGCDAESEVTSPVTTGRWTKRPTSVEFRAVSSSAPSPARPHPGTLNRAAMPGDSATQGKGPPVTQTVGAIIARVPERGLPAKPQVLQHLVAGR